MAVVTGTDDAPTSVLVDPTASTLTAGPSGARLLATSADGTTLPWPRAGRDRIVIRSTTAWLDGGAAIVAIVEPPPNAVAAISMALDARGDRLAVAWVQRDDAIAIAIYDGSLRLGARGRTVHGRCRGGGARLVPLTARVGGRSGQAVGTASVVAEKMETWASSGSITPMTFCRVRRWTHDPQLSK